MLSNHILRVSEMIESEIVNEVLEDLAQNTQANYKTTLRQFLTFVNSKEDLNEKISIDYLIAEAKSDVSKTQERMDLFYRWLQGIEVSGYKRKRKPTRESSAHQRVYSYLRGFFVNLDVAFKKKWKRTIPKVTHVKQAIKKDQVYTFYDVDEKTRTIRFNRDRMQQFLANLKLRDQAITLALLSSALDSGDLFKVNIGDAKNQSNNRIYLTGTRQKTTVLFKTFISKEATRYIFNYIKQERQGADDSEPLFVYSRNGKEKRMTSTNLASIYRDAARRMGLKWENGERNPLRPKRMRHLFRTACDTAGIPELYTNAYMGHRNHQGQDYSELSRAKLELEYLRVEPFLTVYGEIEESLEIKEDVAKLEKIVVKLNREVEEQKRTIESLSNLMENKVEEITRKLWDKWLTDLKQEELFAIKAEQKEREQTKE
jgi:integrase